MPFHRPHQLAAAVLGAAAVASCAPVPSLLHPSSPRFEGRHAAPATDPRDPGTVLRVVTFNIRYAREIARAIEVLESDSLRGADVLALQEMDDRGVARIARALRLNYAYYPATVHPGTRGYFGPAVLSRWPIERSWKVLLPHEGRGRRQRRTATAALVRVGTTPVVVYAVHLETPLGLSEARRRDQAMAIVADAARHAGPVVIAGDFNSETIGTLFQQQGYRWLTRRVGATISIFSWDHIFSRGLRAPHPGAAGVVREVRGASDHRPVWAVLAPSDAVAATP